jgi:lipid A 3-O-deacylase
MRERISPLRRMTAGSENGRQFMLSARWIENKLPAGEGAQRGSMRTTVIAVLALFAVGAGSARADFVGLTADEENDSIVSSSDQHYTQGLRFAATWFDDSKQQDVLPFAYNFLSWLSPGAPQGGTEREYSLLLGQSVFTPNRIGNPIPNPADRPYAGWLYTGLSLTQQHRFSASCCDAELENLELEIGVVGPDAQAAQVQIAWHKIFGFIHPMGWAFQLHNEPGVVLTYERKVRVELLGNEAFGIDVIPEAGISAGNVLTYGEVGAIARLGFGLGRDYGPARARPAPSGSDWFEENSNHPFGAYVFAGAQGRLVGRNIFLDGNTWESSPHVDKLPVVTDLVAGVSAFWSTDLRLDISLIHRSKEFKGQPDPDNFASISLSSDF